MPAEIQRAYLWQIRRCPSLDASPSGSDDKSEDELMARMAVMVCGHGSRDREAIREFELLAGGIRARLPDCNIETGYLEFAQPVIRDGLEALKRRGAKRILAVPGMLFAASHVKNDLPWEINSFAAENPGVE